MRHPHNIEPYPQSILFLLQFLRTLHHHKYQVRYHDKKWTILGKKTQPSDKSTIFRREVTSCDIYYRLGIIKADYSFIDISFQPYSCHIFWVGSFETAKKRYSSKQRQVINDRIRVHVILIRKARHLKIAYLPIISGTERKDSLSFIRIYFYLLHSLSHGEVPSFHITLR